MPIEVIETEEIVGKFQSHPYWLLLAIFNKILKERDDLRQGRASLQVGGRDTALLREALSDCDPKSQLTKNPIIWSFLSGKSPSYNSEAAVLAED